ncbi:hypothetical protein VOLCADRAFT_96436 [Volvox carteri f. nagariensis]|uniref:Uncharacterized protein n=1 Tax=Volvox carteri f. nagariensis TaxID=3068 RepID=D8UA38_VOLCA|nr:uncharacterized protein VOLCADRAFT_96436 [Volvox carteri f. nagariensis]EFJ43357.1 hypothetical protein VOLCADRAFT_96436 [Volvox carteri f. nagariensis]|eukprot:XP_002955504.1 hypothetical protein VOLCADRAFT_96436 [Volvox carteri f. nagariensis]
MSGKFKRSQRHQRWNEEGTSWSNVYLKEISAVEADAAAPAPLRNLASELQTLSRAHYTYGEVEELRRVLAAFQKPLQPPPPPPPSARAACDLLAGLLFQPGSRPLHRAVLGATKRLTTEQLGMYGSGSACTAVLLNATVFFSKYGSRPVSQWFAIAFCTAAATAAPTAARNSGPTASGPSAAAEAPCSVPLGEVLASLLWLPASYDWIWPIAAAVVWQLAAGVDGVLAAADRGALHIAPGLMEEVLDAVGALYYLLQHHGPHLVAMEREGGGMRLEGAGNAGEGEGKEDDAAVGVVSAPHRGGREAVVLAGTAMLRALQASVVVQWGEGRALVREALASAAVVLWAASLLPGVPPAAAAAAFGQGLFFGGSATGSVLMYDAIVGGGAAAAAAVSITSTSASPLAPGDAPLGSWLDDWLRNQRGSSLVSELRRFSPIGRICSLKGLVTAMPKPQRPAATGPVTELGAAAAAAAVTFRPWHFLVDGALSYGCSSIRDAPDAHFKFHAACVLCFCVSKVLDSWQQFQQLQQQQQQQQEQEQQEQEQQQQQQQQQERHADDEPPNQEPINAGSGEVAAEEAGVPLKAAAGTAPLQPALLHTESLNQLMGLMWANLDEPLAQTARQLQDAFQLLLEVLSCQDHYRPGVLPPLDLFRRQVVGQLLAVPYNRKGRYAPLGCMAERGCALGMLRDHPSLIPEALMAMESDTTASAASSFLKTLLAAARTETSMNPQLAAEAAAAAAGGSSSGRNTPSGDTSSGTPHLGGGGGAGISASSLWVELWRGALLRVLYGANEKLRAYVSVHALPVVLGLEPSSALELIRVTLSDPAPEPVPGTSRVAALVAAARGMGLIADLDSLLGVSGLGTAGSAPSPASPSPASPPLPRLHLEPLLMAAVDHVSEAVRLDALELACVSFKMSDPPGRLELAIAGRWSSLCMRSTAQGSRNKCLVLVTKLVARIRLAVAHIHNKMCSRGGPAHPASSKGKGVQVLFCPGAAAVATHGAGSAAEAAADGSSRTMAATATTDPRVTDPTAVLERLQAFMQWLTRLLISGLYPGSPYERRFFSLELLSAVLEAWGPDGSGSSAAASGGGGGKGAAAEQQQQQQRHRQGTSGGRMAESTALTLLPKGYVLGSFSSSSSSSSGAGGNGGGGPRSGRGAGAGAGAGTATVAAPPPFRPYCPELLSSNTVALLLAAAVDSWDKLRQAASSCLMRLPTPLPGLSSVAQLTPLLAWAAGLLNSPRARESDAGARLIKILYGKYVAGCGWRLQLHPKPRALPPPPPPAATAQHPQHYNPHPDRGSVPVIADPQPYAAVLDFLDAVLDLVNSQVAAAREDLAAACRRSLAHGPLLLLRYVVEDVPWGAVCASPAGLAAAAGWAAKALAAAEELVGLALPVLSRPQERNVGAEEVDTTMMAAREEEGEDEGGSGDDGDAGEGEEGDDGDLGPESQVIITACWTTVKEVSLVLATMVRHMPLPTSASANTTTAATSTTSAAAAASTSTSSIIANNTTASNSSSRSSSSILSCDQLRQVGELLLRLLFEMKHNGAVDKTALALTAVSERLLRGSASELNGLPRPWLEACIRRVLAPNQTRDDIVRRSAGLPFAFGALFHAEPGNAPKTLLARGMNALLAVAAAASTAGPYLSYLAAAETTEDGERVVVVDGYEVRQVWPVVHAFNCLRHAFNDGNLSVDTSGYFAPAIQACLRALRSPAWEIRNSAMLCFTALTARVLGFKNDSHGESCRKAVSGTEFFQRYPALHGFLLAQLREAATELEEAAAAAAVAAGGASASFAPANPHPGLYPVLIILSRLKPSHIRNDGGSYSTPLKQQQQEEEGERQEEDQSGGGAPAAAAAAAPVGAASAVTTYMGALTPVAFTPLVRRCATAAPYAVRRLAARALGPLVAAQDVPALLQQLLESIPAEPSSGGGAAAAAAAVGSVRTVVGSTNANALHGALLQSAALLETAAAARPGGGGANPSVTINADGGHGGSGVEGVDVLTVALPHLARGAWLADPRVGCSALGCGLLQAASAALSLLPPERCNEFRAEVAALAAACRAAVGFEPPAVRRQRQMGGAAAAAAAAAAAGGVNVFVTDYPDPMRSQLLKQTAQLWLGPVLLCQAFRSSSPAGFFLEGLLHQLRCCLASYSYDTRAAALKSLVRVLAAINSGAVALASSSSSSLSSPSSSSRSTGGTSAEAAAAAAAAEATSRGIAAAAADADAGGKLPRIVADLLARPVLTRRLISEGMALLWEAVASEPVHKVVRRALKALGLLHSLSIALTAATDASTTSTGTSDLRTEDGPTITPAGAAVTAAAAAEAAAARGSLGWSLQHPLGCLCCSTDPRVIASSSTMAAGGGLRAALTHVTLVQRLLTEGCKELEARCEALRCLGRALGSAMLAAAAAAEPPPALHAALEALLEQVATGSQPWQPEDWRLASAEALAASRLLHSTAVRRRPVGRGGSPHLPSKVLRQGQLSAGQLPPQPQHEQAPVQAQAQGRKAEAGGAVGSLELLAVRGWRCIVAFLEDEDHAVRYTAARLAQEVMELAGPLDVTKYDTSSQLSAGHDPSSSGLGSSGSGDDKIAAGGTAATVYGRQPLYVEAVIRRVYPWLAVQYGSCDSVGGVSTRSALVDMLCGLVTSAGSGCGGGAGEDADGSGAAVPEVVAAMTGSSSAAAAAAPVSWGSCQARRLFDKEADNPHEEPLLTAHLAARTLRMLMAAPPPPPLPLTGDGSDAIASAPMTPLASAASLTPLGAARLARWAAMAVRQLGAVAAAMVPAGRAAASAAADEEAGSGASNGNGEDVSGVNGPTSDGWLGGFINHPEVFASACEALLALWTLGPVRQHVLAVNGGSADALESALRALRDRDDVRKSQLAPLLLAVEFEWVGTVGLGGQPFFDVAGQGAGGENPKEGLSRGKEAAEVLQMIDYNKNNLLFLF